jgi:hypothetical protein
MRKKNMGFIGNLIFVGLFVFIVIEAFKRYKRDACPRGVLREALQPNKVYQIKDELRLAAEK